uniref:Uncharacterized protein n=1 Tax=Arundo donax TaxID=35708 RepID=A0A0A9GMV9_ARUDO
MDRFVPFSLFPPSLPLPLCSSACLHQLQATPWQYNRR